MPQPGIEPGTLTVRVPSPNHWIAKEFPKNLYFLIQRKKGYGINHWDHKLIFALFLIFCNMVILLS